MIQGLLHTIRKAAAVVGPAAAFAAVSLTPVRAADEARSERTFIFDCRGAVGDIPEGAQKVAVWLPLPKSDENQDIKVVATASPGDHSIHSEPVYGNNMMYFEVAPPPKGGMLYFGAAYTVRRRDASPVAAPRPEGDIFLRSERLSPLSGPILALARQATAGKTSDLEKARAIYDFVTTYMSYDKSEVGWGQGDVLRACEVRKGNCTDFHALLIGMARAAGIPARFKIGFPLPPDAESGDVPGYHCWAELYIGGIGWLPVDSSEAFKHPELKDYYFGKLDPNRVEFTTGRDLVLAPKQSGPPLNYFIYPYVEVDGKPFGDVNYVFRFQPLAETARIRQQTPDG